VKEQDTIKERRRSGAPQNQNKQTNNFKKTIKKQCQTTPTGGDVSDHKARMQAAVRRQERGQFAKRRTKHRNNAQNSIFVRHDKRYTTC
jgi:hypothetical protein